MLSYMLPVEEKSPSAAAAAAAATATRNLSLNLTTTTATAATAAQPATTHSIGAGGSGTGAGSGAVAAPTAPTVRSIIKPTIKHGTATHRYQLIGSGSGSEARGLQSADEPLEPEQCDESTNLLAAAGTQRDEDEDDDDDDEEEEEDDENEVRGRNGRSGIDDRPVRPCRGSAVKSDKNFNNLIVVTNGGGRHGKKAPTNGNHAGPPAQPKLAGVLKPSNGGGPAQAGAYYNGYIAVSGDNDDEDHHRLLVSANNLRNTSVEQGQQQQQQQQQQQEWPYPAATTEPTRSASFSRSNGNCRNTMNSLNGNLNGGDPAVAPLPPLEASEIGGGGGGGADVSLGSDSDSATGAGGSGSTATTGGGGGGGGGKKVKLNKLGGNKNVTLKRVSFGSSKGSMVETLVFETPTPLPEHAEREFFQSPAVLAGAGHTTVYSGGSGHHHYPAPAALAGPTHPHTHHHHAPMQAHHHQHHHLHHHQYQSQYPGGYHPLDGGTVATGHHDDSGIELQEEVERSKVRVSFFQSSKPQSISPPESLHLYGGQSLIQFGGGGGGAGGGYDNNNSPLDTYITSAALNQQYDSLSGHQQHQQQHAHFHPDHRDPNMAAVYGGTNVPPSAFNRQMSTESGWDNPFRPGGDLSREADEIVNLIKGGKPITPTGDQSLVNGSTPKDSHAADDPDSTVTDGAVTKLESSQLQAAQQQNGTKSPHKSPGGGGGGGPSGTGSPALAAKNGTKSAADGAGSTVHNSSTTPISNQVIPGPQSASHVVIDEKKKKKCTCCVIQ